MKYNTLRQGARADAARPREHPGGRGSRPVVQPQVSTEQLAKKYPAVILVNRGTFKLTLYKNLKPAKTYGIAVGQVGLETPAGLYHVQNKAINPAWHVPNSEWAGELAGKVIPADDPGTRSRRAGWASSTAPASTARRRTARSAPPRRTAASGCTSRTSRSSTTRCRSAPRSTSPRRSVHPKQRRNVGDFLYKRYLLPALLQQGGMVLGVPNARGCR